MLAKSHRLSALREPQTKIARVRRPHGRKCCSPSLLARAQTDTLFSFLVALGARLAWRPLPLYSTQHTRAQTTVPVHPPFTTHACDNPTPTAPKHPSTARATCIPVHPSSSLADKCPPPSGPLRYGISLIPIRIPKDACIGYTLCLQTWTGQTHPNSFLGLPLSLLYSRTLHIYLSPPR